MPRKNRVTLTDRSVGSATVPPGRRTLDLFDALVPGLVLRVSSTGRRSFYTVHRSHDAQGRAVGARQWTAIRDPLLRDTESAWPALTLLRARELARRMLEAAGTGTDPDATQAAAHTAAANVDRTFDQLFTEYLDKHARPNKKTWQDDALDYRTQIKPYWEHRPVVGLRRADVRERLDAIVARGAKIRANRIQSLIRKVLNFGLDREWIEFNVAAKMAKPSAEGKRKRRLSPPELRAFWAWLDRRPIEPLIAGVPESTPAKQWRLFRAMLKLRLLTAARGNEILLMQWEDLDWESEDGVWWTVPETKNGRSHRIPITAEALKVIRDLEDFDRTLAGYVFKGIRGKVQRRGLLVDLPFKEGFLPRDLRRTVTTNLAALKVDRFTVKQILNHKDQEVTADYDLYAYGEEKRAALDKWAARLIEIIANKPDPLRIVRSA